MIRKSKALLILAFVLTFALSLMPGLASAKEVKQKSLEMEGAAQLALALTDGTVDGMLANSDEADFLEVDPDSLYEFEMSAEEQLYLVVTAPQDGYLVIQSASNEYTADNTDMMIKVYNDPSLSEDSYVTECDDYDGTHFKLLLDAAEGETYYLVVEEYSGEPACFDLYVMLYDPSDFGYMDFYYDSPTFVDGEFSDSWVYIYDPVNDWYLENGVDYEITGFLPGDQLSSEEWVDFPEDSGYHYVRVEARGDLIGEAYLYVYVQLVETEALPFPGVARVEGEAWFSFTAPQTGYYCFESEAVGDADPVLFISSPLDSGYILARMDDGKGTLDFKRYYYLLAGESVVVNAWAYTSNESTEFDLISTYEGTIGFKDVPLNAWYAKNNALGYVYSYGIMSGTSDTTFSPATNVTRAQVAMMLWQMAGQPAYDEDAYDDFRDVKADKWYYDAIMWARSEGIINGVGNNKFAPNNAVTREQFAVMLFNFTSNWVGGIEEDYAPSSESLRKFSDYGKVSLYAKTAMVWAVESGILSGSDNKLMPKNGAQRCQAAQMMTMYSRGYIYY